MGAMSFGYGGGVGRGGRERVVFGMGPGKAAKCDEEVSHQDTLEEDT